MKKILLFYPSFTLNSNDDPLYANIPLSVLTLGQSLMDDYDVQIIDQRFDGLSGIEKAIESAFMLGISTTTGLQITNGLEFAGMARRINPDIKIVWGGWHPSLMPHETIKHALVDVVLVGQGEKIINSLADCLYSKRSLESVPNLVYKDGGEIKSSKTEKYSDFQLPESMIAGYGLIDIDKYMQPVWDGYRIMGYESSRGCPFSCTFCSIKSLFNRKWHGMRAENLLNDIAFLKKNHGINAMHFFDNNFFCSNERVFEFARGLLDRNMDVKWDGTVVIDQFLRYSSQEMELMVKSNWSRIIVGVESGDSEVLKNINKKHTNEQVIALVRKCKDYDIVPSLSFMLGFPWNPEKDIDNTLKLVEQIKSIYDRSITLLFSFSPYLGTEIFKTAQEYGVKFPDSLEGWAKYTHDNPVTPWISPRLKKTMQYYLKLFGTKQ
ncbi:MAG: B12-binding domain-containing radical SAM protein [Defluviitaleaceae bacterium]|nr:B12-binding domain-containing radical SAM protein [Defluviitaleaceae bacterium]